MIFYYDLFVFNVNLWLLLGVTGADLTDADLRGADFSLANVAKVSPPYPKEV
jgi:uncharacterized protein YjbI with pentapeptide repeats